MSNDGITAITLTTDEGSVTVTPEAFDHYAASLKRGASMTTATAVQVPTELDFGDAAFLVSPELSELAADLIELRPEILGHLADVDIAYFWRNRGGKKSGAPVFGKTTKQSGLLSAFTTADFIVWLAADHVAAAEYTPRQIEALLHHELLHITYKDPSDDDEDGERKYFLRDHDFEGFVDEVRTYGAWEELLKEAATAFQQAPLFE